MSSKNPTVEDLIATIQSERPREPGIIEALLSTVDGIFTQNRKLQKSRLTARQIRGVVKMVGSQTYSRTVTLKQYRPFIDDSTGEFSSSTYDNRVLTAVGEAVITGRISLNGQSRKEIIEIFKAVSSQAEGEEGAKTKFMPSRSVDF